MSANPLPKRLLSLVLTFCMVLSLVPMSALATGDSSSDPDRVDNAIVNGSFEEPGQTDKAPQLDYVPGWSTTATDRLIEFGVNTKASSAPQLWGTDKSIPDGNQFAELNADEVSTLYQNVSTVDGHIYEWGLSHRGRMGTDTMALIIGPKQDNAPRQTRQKRKRPGPVHAADGLGQEKCRNFGCDRPNRRLLPAHHRLLEKV